MTYYITKGIIAGLGLSILVGPILIAIIEQSLRNGRRAGFSMASGIWISDLVYVFICYYSLEWITRWSMNSRVMLMLGLIGAVVLLIMGIVNIQSYRSDSISEIVLAPKVGTKRLALAKGFSLNSFNPFTVGFWIALSVYFTQNDGIRNQDFLIMSIALLCTVIIFDGLKIVAAGFLRKKLTAKNLATIKLITGIAFVAFGIFIAMQVVRKYGF